MPLYEYQCEACGSRFEKIRQFSDPPLAECPKCGKGPVTKLLSSPAIQFKGSGFYINDYAKKSSPDSSASSESKRGESESKSKSDSKSDSKSEGTSSTGSTNTSTTSSDKSDKPAKKDS